jgi:hypothetical protein
MTVNRPSGLLLEAWNFRVSPALRRRVEDAETEAEAEELS